MDKCRVCSKDAEHVHHKDLNRKNNHKSNLVYLCAMCHKGIHAFMNNDDPFVPNKNVLKSKWALNLIKKHKHKCGIYNNGKEVENMDKVRCPECNKATILYRVRVNGFICRSCGHTWKKKNKKGY